jgi:hypothetical protein
MRGKGPKQKRQSKIKNQKIKKENLIPKKIILIMNSVLIY